jgi:hypothetical protein
MRVHIHRLACNPFFREEPLVAVPYRISNGCVRSQ